MTSHIIFDGMYINYIINEINVKRNHQHNTSSYVGGEGSNTTYISSDGRTISFKSICRKNEQSPHGRGHRINDYIYLANRYKKVTGVLTSPSESNINGNYLCVKMDYIEDTGGNYEIDWEFQEVIKFNVVNKTFRVWGKAKKKTTSTTTKKTTKNNPVKISSNLKYLLKTCGTMVVNDKKKKCVKSLQKFLQSQGYYKGYKIDGLYQKYTKKAVQSLQKKYKLKVTGKWDKNTRSYFQKKYKYP